MARVTDRFTSRCLAVALLLALCAPATALLPPAVALADANSEARVFFERANRQLAEAMRLRGRRRERGLQEALGSYVSSLRIVRSRNALFNAGVTLQELGRADEAFSYFVEYKQMPGLTDAERADIAQRIEVMRPRLALVVVNATPAAEVRVDRRDLAVGGTTPLELAVAAGEHTFYLSAAGYEDAEAHATAVVGATQQVDITLQPRPGSLRVLAPANAVVTLDGAVFAAGSAVPVPAGTHALRVALAGRTLTERSVEILPGAAVLEIDATRGNGEAAGGPGELEVIVDVAARVLVDGQPLGTGRRVMGPIGAGTHRLRVEAAGRLPYQSTISVQADNRTRLEVTLGVDPDTLTELGAWPTVMLVATTTTLTLGVVSGLLALGTRAGYQADRDMYDPTMATQAQYENLERSRTLTLQFNGFADVMWLTTAAFGLTTLLLYLIDDDDPGGGSTGSITIAPMASRDVLGGAFAMRLP